MELYDRALCLNQKEVLKQSDDLFEPFLALPKDVAKYTVTWMLDRDGESADAFNACAGKQGIGKALLCYGLVHKSKGIPGLSKAQSVGMLCSSTETYLLCKRLMPEFMRQEQDKGKFAVDDRQKIKILYAQHKRIWKETQDICVTNHELTLLHMLPATVKAQIEQSCVMPQLSWCDKTLVLIGNSIVLPTVVTVMFGLTVGQRITNYIHGIDNERSRQLASFNEVFDVPYSFIKNVMRAKTFYFYDPIKIKNVFKGLRSDLEEEDCAE
jgi:hypothetical protein